MSIHLIEMAGKVLPPMQDFSSRNALEYLESLGVQVWLNTAVKSYDGAIVETNKKSIPASTLIWAAGVKGNIIEGLQEGADFKMGRYLVNEWNQIGEHQSIYAIGDVASMQTESLPKGHPMLAQVAIQQGMNLAKNLNGQKEVSSWKKFVYKDKGTMTAGRTLSFDTKCSVKE